jgi:CDP-glycerol glycerophosphotransferase (TagB/SpsB family)
MRWMSPQRAAWSRIDLLVSSDPWSVPGLRRCRRRINFFHGVAGKYDLECPAGLPLDLAIYDRIAFPNAARMHRYLSAGLVSRGQAALIGFPKLDVLVNSRLEPRAAAAALGLTASAATAIYAPTFSPQSSLQRHGEQIVAALLESGLNVIVKLHDRSLDPDPKYSGGEDWRRRFEAFGHTGRFLFAADADSSAYLLASDVMVTDHSTIGFEFCALDRPLIVFDMPELLAAARVDAGRARLLKNAADVVEDIPALRRALEHALNRPQARHAQRAAAVNEVFYEPGGATGRALALCYAQLECPVRAGMEPGVAAG